MRGDFARPPKAAPAGDPMVAALNRIADAIVLLARATAGEFDEQPDDVERVSTDMAGRPIR